MEVPLEMQQRLLATRAELQAVKARIAAANQDKKILDLTSKQVANEETTGHVWQGVGRMFVKTSTDDFKKNVTKRNKELDEQLSALAKKETYYATTLDKMILTFSVTQE